MHATRAPAVISALARALHAWMAHNGKTKNGLGEKKKWRPLPTTTSQGVGRYGVGWTPWELGIRSIAKLVPGE